MSGPESSGKSTLARQLAWALDGLYVAEAARTYLHQTDGAYQEENLVDILQLQLQAEDRAAVASFVICDTGPEVLQVWSEVKYGRVAEKIVRAGAMRSYDLTLLCAPDLPWRADPLRESPDRRERQRLFDRYREMLPEATVISGGDRTVQALRRMRALRLVS